MKKIAYIELDTHAEIARNFMELMKDSKVFSVDYYFSEKISNQINEKLSNVYVTESSAISNDLKNKNYDLVITGTVHRYFNVFEKIISSFNTSIIIHNLNFSTISKSQLFLNIFKKDFAFRLKLLLKENLLSAPNIFKNAKNLLVLDKSLIKQNENLELKFLSVFFNEIQISFFNEVFTVVIPGAVSQKRRDYNRIISKIVELETEIKKGLNLQEKLIEFIFLGKAQGNELKKIIDLERSLENLNVKYFTEKVSQSIFDEWMQKADVLWCPIQKKTEFFSQTEIYGKTKMSGNIGDAIKYGKKAIFPADFSTDYLFIHRENTEVFQQLFQLKKEQSFNFQNDYHKDIILRNLEKQLVKLL